MEDLENGGETQFCCGGGLRLSVTIDGHLCSRITNPSRAPSERFVFYPVFRWFVTTG
ncbi:MAG TPA: hypothetical protein VIT91_09190 [Chthoniobacterales bacterium]